MIDCPSGVIGVIAAGSRCRPNRHRAAEARVGSSPRGVERCPLTESTRVILVIGEVGIGKTRLLDEMARTIVRAGRAIFRERE